MARVKKVRKLIRKIKKIIDDKANYSKSRYNKTSIKELEQNKIYLSTYMLERQKNSDPHNLQYQIFNPVVHIKRCKIVEQLISDYQSGHVNNVRHNIDESNKANEMVSNLTTSISNINSNMKSTNSYRNQTSDIDKPKFIQSLKVTTEVDAKTRKVDVIPILVETVSMKNRDIKLMNKKFLWNISNDFEINGLREIFKISSTDTIFKDASLEFHALSAGRSSSKVSLSQRISSTSSPTFSIVNKWSLCKSVDHASKLESNQSIGLDKYKNLNNLLLPVQVCDCPSQGSGYVRSESSGYLSEQKLSENSPVSSTVSSPKRKISYDYSDTFRLPSKSIRTNSSTVTVQNNLTPTYVNKRKYDFKVPRLPVIKRPPTRIKKSDVKQSTSGIETNNSVYRLDMDDSDAISLYAESVCLGLEEKVKHNCVNKTSINSMPIAFGFSNPGVQHTDDVLQSSNKSTSYTNKINENLKHSKALFTTSRSVETDTSKVNDWIVSTTKNHVNNSNFINIFKKICHKHFGNGKCLRERCWFNHKLPYDFENTLRELPEQQFQLALGEILKYKYLFKETFDTVLLYFKENNQIDALIYLINDILKLDFDKTPFIKKVIHTLKDMGYSFVEAIDEILLTHGRKTQSLQDILLMLIVEEDDCLENNWHFINKITKFRKNKLDYGVVCEIFQKCCNTDDPKKEFCENIYKDLIIKSHVELDKIDRHLVIKYIYLLYHFNLVEYAEQLKQNNNIKDQEIISSNFKETIFEDVSNPNIELNSKSCSSCTSCSESSSTNSTTTEGNSQHEEESVLKGKYVTKQNFAYEKEEIHIPNVSANVEENETKEAEEKNSSTNTHNSRIEQNYPLFQADSPLQFNCNYSNSDLEAYLTHVNRDTYLSNYCSPKEMLSSNKSCSNSIRLDCSSPSSGHFNSSQSPQGISPMFLSSTNTENEILHCAEFSESENITEEEVSDIDIMKLVTGINQKDLSAIFSIMKKCADNDMPRSFVIHTITALKKMSSIAAHDIIMSIFENLEGLMPHLVNQSSSMKNLIKLLAFNILPMLDKGKEYGVATRVISIFAKEMDSFIETKCIQNFRWLCTTKLRYIFIFKIFVRDRKLKEALKLLKSCNLNLFQYPSAEMELIHNDYKKRILNEFVDIALQRDIQVARETILYLMLNMDSAKNFIDLMKFLNQLLVKLLNSYSSYKPELLGLIDNITNGWFKYLKPSIMRGILIQAFHDLSERRLMEFFNLCVDIGIYRIHKGFDNSIGIPKNLLPEEIQLILHIHFYKICKSNFPLHNIVISVESQIDVDEYAHQINVFTNTILDNRDIITRILNVCAKFEHFPNQEKMCVSSELITIPYEYLKYFFIPYRTSLPSITKFR